MNFQENKNVEKQEKSDIAIRSRKHIDVTGVVDVMSFDDRSVSMMTELGEMTVEGEGLKVGTLDTDKGIVSVDGKISAVIYYDEVRAPDKKGRLGRLFSR